MPTGWHLNAIAMPGLHWTPPFGISGGACLWGVQRTLRGKGQEHPLGTFERETGEVRHLGLILLGQLDF